MALPLLHGPEFGLQQSEAGDAYFLADLESEAPWHDVQRTTETF